MKKAQSQDKLLYSQQEVQQLVQNVAFDVIMHLDQAYPNENPIVLGILTGGVYFTVDLTRHLSVAHQVEFTKVSSYPSAMQQSVMQMYLPIPNVKDRVVVISDEFLDSGKTITYIGQQLKEAGAKGIIVATLLTRDNHIRQQISSELNAFVATGAILDSDDWLYGYGLDHGQDPTSDFRALQEIYAISK